MAKNADEIRRQAIVVLSDGEDTSSLLPFEEVLDLAKRSETAIYAIGLRSTDGPGSTSKGFKEAEFVLRQFAQETGGRAFFPNQISELAAIYGQISDELSSQYTVGYTSRNGRRDGSWRRVVVRVARPNLDRANQARILRADAPKKLTMNLAPLVALRRGARSRMPGTSRGAIRWSAVRRRRCSWRPRWRTPSSSACRRWRSGTCR